VLVVDDHPMLRVGVVSFLSDSSDCDVVGETNNAAEGLELARLMRPDIVLLDIRLRGERNGIDLARDLREQVPDAKIVVLTNFPHEPYVRAMMELGVDGYLLKDTPPSDILEGLRMVMGVAFSPPRLAQTLSRAISTLPTTGREKIKTR
jgi:DNA-binding NarL/FixJ family response regulator